MTEQSYNLTQESIERFTEAWNTFRGSKTEVARADVVALWRVVGQAPSAAEAAALEEAIGDALSLPAFLALCDSKRWRDAVKAEALTDALRAFENGAGRVAAKVLRHALATRADALSPALLESFTAVLAGLPETDGTIPVDLIVKALMAQDPNI